MSGSTLVALLGHSWRRHPVTLASITLAVGLFEFIFTRMAPSPNEISWMKMMLGTMSEQVRGLMGNEAVLSGGGFLALGYVHPFVMLLASVWVVRVSSAAIAGEIGIGTMDLLASRPVPRWHFVAAGFMTLAIGVAAIFAIGFLGTTIGLELRELDVHVSAFRPVIVVATLLFAAWGAVGLAIGAMCRDASQSIAWTTAVIAVSFVLDYLARLWTTIASLRRFSLFRYYEPQAILSGGVPDGTVVVFMAALVVALAVAHLLVRARDL